MDHMFSGDKNSKTSSYKKQMPIYKIYFKFDIDGFFVTSWRFLFIATESLHTVWPIITAIIVKNYVTFYGRKFCWNL